MVVVQPCQGSTNAGCTIQLELRADSEHGDLFPPMDTVTRPSQPRQRSPRSDTDVPLFLGRRHSSASRSGTLNCGHRLHRKALSLDTTPLLHGSASSTYYSTLFITESLEFSQQKPLSETAILSQPRTLHLGSLIESKLVSLSCVCSAEAKVDTDPPSSTFETPDDRQPLSSGTECDTQNAMVTRPANPSEQVNHQAIDLTRRVADRAIRVERDYSKGDGITRFSIDYPPQLTGKVVEESVAAFR